MKALAISMGIGAAVGTVIGTAMGAVAILMMPKENQLWTMLMISMILMDTAMVII